MNFSQGGIEHAIGGLLEKQIEKVQNTKEQSYTYRKLSNQEIDEKVARALKIVDLDALEERDVTTLSGGQQQRVAIARAMINSPGIIFADEPSGNLDSKTKTEIHSQFFKMRDRHNSTFIIVTHDMELAQMCDRKMVLADGVFK